MPTPIVPPPTTPARILFSLEFAYMTPAGYRECRTNATRRRADTAAHEIAIAALGRDPGPLACADSSSHRVYVSPHAVLKMIDAGGHGRLAREIALAPHLPAELTAPLLASGLYRLVG
jgi:hypothetical protein